VIYFCFRKSKELEKNKKRKGQVCQIKNEKKEEKEK